MLDVIPNNDEPVYVADVGCGSGCVGLSIAVARPNVRLYAIDISDVAIGVTRDNVVALGLTDRVGVLKGDLLAAIPPSRNIDWVVSNPPYIPSRDIDGLMPEVSKWEPRKALDGGPDGLQTVRRLAEQAGSRARQGIALEIGHTQASKTMEILLRAGFVDTQTHKDLANIDRVVSARKP
jgi:release factor glutamine methyltransferase